jgi:hypothetical protein
LAIKILGMKRQLIALIAMLVIGLQSSVVAFAGISPMGSTDCQAAVVTHSDVSRDPCCPKGEQAMGFCLQVCTGSVAGAATTVPQGFVWLGSATLLPHFLLTRFSSRGDTPLFRPPIP